MGFWWPPTNKMSLRISEAVSRWLYWGYLGAMVLIFFLEGNSMQKVQVETVPPLEGQLFAGRLAPLERSQALPQKGVVVPLTVNNRTALGLTDHEEYFTVKIVSGTSAVGRVVTGDELKSVVPRKGVLNSKVTPRFRPTPTATPTSVVQVAESASRRDDFHLLLNVMENSESIFALSRHI